MTRPLTDAEQALATVTLNYRYSGAWHEVGTRIALRQNAVTMYVTLSSAILTILSTASRLNFPIDLNMFSLLMPAVSFFLALLNFKHDKTIALLRNFMRECERSGAAERLNLVGYNLNPRFREDAEWYRNLHDVSAALLIIVFNGIGLIIAYYSFPTLFDPTRWPIFVYVGGMLISLALVMHSSLESSNLFNRRRTTEQSQRRK